MKKPKQFLTISLILFLVSTVIVSSNDHTAHACTCMQPLSPDEELPRFDVVFSGKVTNIEEIHRNDQTFSSMDPVFVTFDVYTIWKGDKKDMITVMTAQSSASCGFNFADDQEYIIYAKQYNAEKLEVNLCSRTGPLSDAIEDLQELGLGLPTKPEIKSPNFTISAKTIQKRDSCRTNTVQGRIAACHKI